MPLRVVQGVTHTDQDLVVLALAVRRDERWFEALISIVFHCKLLSTVHELLRLTLVKTSAKAIRDCTDMSSEESVLNVIHC